MLQGKGDGMIRLGLEYKSIQTIGNMSLRHVNEGLLLVTVIRVRSLVGVNKREASSKVYLKVRIPCDVVSGCCGYTACLAWGAGGKDTAGPLWAFWAAQLSEVGTHHQMESKTMA